MQIHTSKAITDPTLIKHTFTIHITQQHIDRARRLQAKHSALLPSPRYCPIALALKATGRFKYVYVYPNEVHFNHMFTILPKNAKDFIHHFDQEKPVQPTSITITYYVQITDSHQD